MKTRNDTAIFTISPPSSQTGDFVPESEIRGSIQATVSTNGNAILCSMTRMYIRVLAIRRPDHFWTIRDWSSHVHVLLFDFTVVRWWNKYYLILWMTSITAKPICYSAYQHPGTAPPGRFDMMTISSLATTSNVGDTNQPVVTFMYDSVSLLNNRDRMWEWQKGRRYPFRDKLPQMMTPLCNRVQPIITSSLTMMIGTPTFPTSFILFYLHRLEYTLQHRYATIGDTTPTNLWFVLKHLMSITATIFDLFQQSPQTNHTME